jgi:hypothetical protein
VVPVQPWACSLEQMFMPRIVVSHAQVTSNLFSLDTLNLQVCYLTSMCGKIPHYISSFLEPSNDDRWSFHVNFDGLSYSQTYILCYLTAGLMDVLYVCVCGVLTVPALPTLSFINFLLSINLRFFAGSWAAVTIQSCCHHSPEWLYCLQHGGVKWGTTLSWFSATIRMPLPTTNLFNTDSTRSNGMKPSLISVYVTTFFTSRSEVSCVCNCPWFLYRICFWWYLTDCCLWCALDIAIDDFILLSLIDITPSGIEEYKYQDLEL